jgi:hypothetical protein
MRARNASSIQNRAVKQIRTSIAHATRISCATRRDDIDAE